jgi:hypothetical protein
MKEFIQLICLNLVVKKRNFVEFAQVIFYYYRNLKFAKVDFSLLCLYFFHNPFKISKNFLMKKGEKEIYAYGETPLTTIEKISSQCKISEKDKVFELGMGRGRSCFWMNFFINCQVVGIEYIPDFVDRANTIKNKFHVDGVEFRQEDILQSDFSGGSVFYLYGTCYETEFIEKLIEKFLSLPKGTKIITVSYPLSDYSDIGAFSLLKKFPGRFTWGVADVYLQIIK